jgi:hypothetical protein
VDQSLVELGVPAHVVEVAVRVDDDDLARPGRLDRAANVDQPEPSVEQHAPLVAVHEPRAHVAGPGHDLYAGLELGDVEPAHPAAQRTKPPSVPR